MTPSVSQNPVVVSGTPGAGKSSVCTTLAASDPQGVHLATDVFFDFLAHKIDPSLPESDAQNRMVIRAYASAAQVYQDAGYHVYLDGVIGPWMFDEIAPFLGPFHFVLLHTSLENAQARILARDGDNALPEVVARMHRQFEDLLTRFSDHVFVTDTVDTDTLAAQVRTALSSSQLEVRS